jgi:hypothetical protein
MNDISLAAQAVAMGPATIAPPSFDGNGWLVVINLAMMTAGFVLSAMMVVDLLRHLWRNRRRDLWRHPVTIWRMTILCFAIGLTLRAGGEAAVLWAWDPVRPMRTAGYLVAKRMLDPIALSFGMAGLALAWLAARGMVEHLRKQPFPIDMWASVPMLRGPAAIVTLSAIAAIGVVVTR